MFRLRLSGFLVLLFLLPGQVQTFDETATKPMPNEQMVIQPKETQSPTAGSLSLDSLIQEALQQNPGVQSTLRQVQALRYRILQARTLSTVSVGWAGNTTPFSAQQGDPSSYRGHDETINLGLPTSQQM